MKKFSILLAGVMMSLSAHALENGFKGCWVFPQTTSAPKSPMIKIDKSPAGPIFRVSLLATDGNEIVIGKTTSTMSFTERGTACNMFIPGQQGEVGYKFTFHYENKAGEEGCDEDIFPILPPAEKYDGFRQLEVNEYRKRQLLSSLMTFEPTKVECPASP